MSFQRPLHGGCQCGRNQYIVQPPPGTAEGGARVLFDLNPTHRASLSSPFPAYLRVPLGWYHSATLPVFPDEDPALIHRVYEQPLSLLLGSSNTTTATVANALDAPPLLRVLRNPLSFWSEAPSAEADFIRLAIGSLQPDDLRELEEWGAVSAPPSTDEDDEEDEDEDEDAQEAEVAAAVLAVAAAEAEAEEKEKEKKKKAQQQQQQQRQSRQQRTRASLTGLPWLDTYVEGSRLERHLQREQRQQQRQLQQILRQQQQQQPTVELQKRQQQIPGGGGVVRHEGGKAQSADGTVKVEWEVVEWTDGDEAAEAARGGSSTSTPGVVFLTGPVGRDQPSPAKRPKQE